jgi:hypothetical protein
MKFNFKKISAMASSALMVGLTMGVASAASFPMPYSDSSASGVAVVSGSGAGVDDTVAADSIVNYLATKVQAEAAGETTVTGGDSFELRKSTNEFNLGNTMSSFYSKIDEGELSTVLAEGTFSNDANDEFDFEQEISLGTALTLTHFLETDSDFSGADVPVIGFNLVDNTHILNYTLEFSPDAAEAGGVWSSGNDLETTDITLLGKTYYVLTARNTTGINHKLTLLDSANSAIISEGEVSSISAGSASYEVSIDFIDDDEVILKVDGITTNKLAEGGVYKVATDTYVAVKSVLYDSKESGVSKAEVSIGSGKIVLENGQEVKINNEDVSDNSNSVLNAYIETTGNDLDKIILEWDLDDDAWIVPGEDLVLPGFETIKLSMGEFFVPMEEVSTIQANSDQSIRIDTTVKDGDVSIDLLYLNSSITGYAGLGEKSNHILVTNASTDSIAVNLNESEDTFFAVTYISGDDAESYVYEISKIEDNSGKNSTTLNNLAGGSDVYLSEVADEETKGEVTFTLSAASDDKKTATITLSKTGAGTLYADRVVTAEGLQFRLPVSANETFVGVDGYVFFTNSTDDAQPDPTSWSMNFTEEDGDGNIANANSFTVTLGVDDEDGGEPTATDGITEYETEDGSKKYVGYMVSDLATKTLLDKPTSGLNDLEITYHGDEAFASVFVAESAVTVSTGTAGAGSMVFKDTEKASWQGRDVVLVGGSCINTATASALGVASNTCGAAFTSATGVGSGQYLIKSVGDAFTTGKIALVVAGYDKADTQAAATRLINLPSTIDTTAEQGYLGTVGVDETSTITAM